MRTTTTLTLTTSKEIFWVVWMRAHPVAIHVTDIVLHNYLDFALSSRNFFGRLCTRKSKYECNSASLYDNLVK